MEGMPLGRESSGELRRFFLVRRWLDFRDCLCGRGRQAKASSRCQSLFGMIRSRDSIGGRLVEG